MITPSIAAPRPLPMLRGRLLKLSVIGTMVALADWLFFGHAVGISVALFTVALAAAVPIANAVQSGWREVAIATGILIVALLPILEAPSAISILFAMAGLSYFALTAATRISGSLRDKGIAIATLLLAAPFQIFADLIRTYDSEQPRDPQTTSAGPVAAWIIPLLFAGIFLALFASANPVIETGSSR